MPYNVVVRIELLEYNHHYLTLPVQVSIQQFPHLADKLTANPGFTPVQYYNSFSAHFQHFFDPTKSSYSSLAILTVFAPSIRNIEWHNHPVALFQ